MNNLVIDILSYLSGTGGINTSVSNAAGHAVNSNSEDFSTVLTKLYKNISNTSISNNMNLYGFGISDSVRQQAITPNIDTIVQKIKNNKSCTFDVEAEVESYLMQNYGGSEAQVIKNLAGVKNLPPQMTALQNQIFQNIVAKISIEAREKLYSNSDFSMAALYLDDSTVDSSSSSDFSDSSALSSNDFYL